MLRLPRAIAAIAVALASIAPTVRPLDAAARDIFRELVDIDTTHATGSTTRAAEAVAARLKAAGLPAADVQLLGPDARHGNLVARYRGTGAKRPLLLLAHLDVVDARREDWSVDPFRLLERDGRFYGRGTSDDKAMASIFAANLIRLRQEGYAPDRDLILALTADEEGGEHNGVKWLLATHRGLIDAALAINEGGSGEMKNGRNVVNEIQASEKAYQDIRIEARDAGGHSAKPVPDNAIARLAEALTRVAAHEFPARLGDVTREYFSRMAALQSDPQLAADMRAAAAVPPDLEAVERLAEASPSYNAMLRTTCVPTRVRGGFANNALPQRAAATINCRILPGEQPETVRAALAGVIGDQAVSVRFIDSPSVGPASPLTPEIVQAVESATRALWPGVVVVPVMGVGASDGVYLRNAGIPTYGIEGLFRDVDDDRAHGRDERIGVKQYYEALEFQYRLIKALSSRAAGAPISTGR